MGFLDKLKELFGGKQQQINEGIDKTAEAVKDKVPDQHDEKVEQVAEKAKDVVDNLAGDSGSTESPPSTPPPSTPPPSTPPPSAPATGEPA
jgi:MT0933-like antitoxin protein